MEESNALLQNALEDERTLFETVYTTRMGCIIATISATISALSSATIISLISRSTIGLSTTYHRIIFGMSISDFFASIAMALTTLPMPTDMIYTQFEQKSYGNRNTCAAQGFFFVAGTSATFCYNSALCVYYLCSVRNKMSEIQIKKRIEPILHLLILLFSLPHSILFAVGDIYHPTPWDTFCTSTYYPWYCILKSIEDKKSCMVYESNTDYGKFGSRFLLFGFIAGFIILAVSMALISFGIYQQERMLNVYTERVYGRRRNTSGSDRGGGDNSGENEQDSNNTLTTVRSRHYLTKVILVQAFAYVAAFLICQSNVFVSLLSAQADFNRTSRIWQLYHVLTRPLQGFFNLIVFVGHKVFNLRQVNTDMTVCKAILHVFTVKEEPNIIISQVSLVQRQTAEDGGNGDVYVDGLVNMDTPEPKRDSNDVQNPPRPRRDSIHEQNENDISFSAASTNHHDHGVSTNISFSENFEEDDSRDLRRASQDENVSSSYGLISWISSSTGISGRQSGRSGSY